MSENIKTSVFRSENVEDIETLAGHPNVCLGGPGVSVSGILVSDRPEDCAPSDPTYPIYNANDTFCGKLYERTIMRDKNDRLLSSAVKAYDSNGNPIAEIKAEYDRETGKRTQTVITSFCCHEMEEESVETKTVYDDLFIPRKRITLYVKDMEPIRDKKDKELFTVRCPSAFDRRYIIGPNENLLERYKQMVEHCNEIGLYPVYGNTSPAMNPDREYAIEVDNNQFLMIRRDDEYSPFKGDKIVIPGDVELHFCDLSPGTNPLTFRPEAQMRLVEEHPLNLFNIREPSREAQLLAVSKDPRVLEGHFYDEVETYCKSPVTDKKVLMEILKTDPSIVAYMEHRINEFENDDEFMDAVEEARVETYERFRNKDSVLATTENNLLIFSEKKGILPDDITQEELTRVRRALLFRGLYIISPSGDGKTFDITDYHHKQNAEKHSVTPSDVVDFLKKDIYMLYIDDVKMLEGVRKTLKEKTEKCYMKSAGDIGRSDCLDL